MYDAIAEVEEYIVNARFEKKALEKEKTTLENIRRILLNFSALFDIMNEQEQKNLLMYLANGKLETYFACFFIDGMV